jgi:hypothetical protein
VPGGPFGADRFRPHYVISTYTVFNHTIDEPDHLAAGMEWLPAGKYLYEDQHPPLARVMGALGPYLAASAGIPVPIRIAKAIAGSQLFHGFQGSAPWPCGPPKVMKTPDGGARFGLSWSCAVAGRGVFAVSSRCLQPSGEPERRNLLFGGLPGDKDLLVRVHQLQAVADFQFLLGWIIIEALDVFLDALNPLGLDGVALLQFLDEALLFHQRMDAVRSA